MSPCGQAFDIQELQDEIRKYLSRKDLSRCCCVCQRWNRYFDRYVQQTYRLPGPYFGSLAKSRELIARAHRPGRHIRAIQADASRQLFDLIKDTCPNVETMHINRHDNNLLGFNYPYLASFFDYMVHLTTLELFVDPQMCSPAMLWSLAHARSLVTLHIFIAYDHRHSKEFSPEEYLSVVDCCLHVLDLRLSRIFLHTLSGIPESFSKRVRRMLKYPELAPPNVESALARAHQSKPICATQEKALTPTSTTEASLTPLSPAATATNASQSCVQRLEIVSSTATASDLISLVSKCPQLEHLVLNGTSIYENTIAWDAFSKACPALRTLTISDTEASLLLPRLTQLLIMSPNLEEISLYDVDLGRHPRLLDFSGEGQEDNSKNAQRQSFAQLKRVTVSTRQPECLKVLIYFMATFPNLQHVRVSSNSWLYETGVGENVDVIAHFDVFAKSWLCLSTLTSLDVAQVTFHSHAWFVWFVQRVQSMERLHTLKLGLDHVRTAMTTPTILVHETIPPTIFFHFPVVKTLWIVRSPHLPGNSPDPCTYEELLFAIKSAPLLARLVLRSTRESEWGMSERVLVDYPFTELDQDRFNMKEFENYGGGNKPRIFSGHFQRPCINSEVYRRD